MIDFVKEQVEITRQYINRFHEWERDWIIKTVYNYLPNAESKAEWKRIAAKLTGDPENDLIELIANSKLIHKLIASHEIRIARFKQDPFMIGLSARGEIVESAKYPEPFPRVEIEDPFAQSED